MERSDKIRYETDIDIYRVIVYDYEMVDEFELNIKQYKTKPYILRLFGFEFKMPFNSRKTVYGGINRNKFINDITYFSTFVVNANEMKIYRRPRVEIYSFKSNTCQTIYFTSFDDARFYGELKAKENNLNKY